MDKRYLSFFYLKTLYFYFVNLQKWILVPLTIAEADQQSSRWSLTWTSNPALQLNWPQKTLSASSNWSWTRSSRRRLQRARAHRRKMEGDFVFHGHAYDHKPPPLFVTLSNPQGGLGNYMFMVASLVGVARQNKRVTFFLWTPNGKKNIKHEKQ